MDDVSGSLSSTDYVTGVPRGEKALGYVSVSSAVSLVSAGTSETLLCKVLSVFQVNIFNGLNMESMVNFTGTQVRSCLADSSTV